MATDTQPDEQSDADELPEGDLRKFGWTADDLTIIGAIDEPAGDDEASAE